jgi:hypothetical protein
MPLPARQLSFGNKCMPKFNWRSLDDAYYDQIEQAEMTGMAWECLRRNASFEREYQTISSSGRTLSDGFRQHWGLVFRSRPRTILSRADDLLGSRGRADDHTSSPRTARRIPFTHQSGSQQTKRQSIPTRSGWLARCPVPPWRGASYLVQASANRRRCLHGRTTARPRFRIQGECRRAPVARAQWTAPRCAFACHFSASPTANCACPACVGRTERRRHPSRDRRSNPACQAHS